MNTNDFQRKKILFVMNHYPDSRNGGIENVTRLISELLKPKGYEIHVRYLYKSPFDQSDDELFESCEYVEPLSIGKEISKIVRKNDIKTIVNRCVIFASPIIRKAIAGTDCRLITTYNNKPTLYVRKIKDLWSDNGIRFLIKLGVTLAYPFYKRNCIHNLIRKHQRSYEVSDCTVLLSDKYVPEYAMMYGVGIDRTVVINNPIKRGVSISEEEFTLKEKTVLMVTRLDEQQKCVIKSLKVWKKLNSYYSDWKLQIVGNGPDEVKIRAFQQTENVSNVEFIPACDPEEYYKKSSIFLMTSRNEGWPNTLNEAMRYGCVPVVLATFSAIYEMVDSCINGFIITPKTEEEDVRDIKDVLTSLMNDTERIHQLGRAAIEKTGRLSIENIIPQWEKIL